MNWDLSKTGPVIILEAFCGELTLTMQVRYNQANLSSCVLTKWEIDGEVGCHRLIGNNQSWDTYWEAFLDLLPDDLAAEIAHSELTVKY